MTACSGQPDGQTCTLDGADAGAMDAGADAADAGAATERRICLSEQCVVSRCGDGYADDGRGEACDDKKNGNQTDGCRDDCQYTCTTNDHCVAGLKCVLSQCNLTTHTCGPQTADTCDDGDACTADSCNSSTGACVNTFIDEDGDGYSSKTCSASGAYADKGGDCVDSSSVTGSASVFPGAMTYYATPHNIAGQKPFDYNCDGVEERRTTTYYSGSGACHSGWDIAIPLPLPACGETATWCCIKDDCGYCQILPPCKELTQECR
ncbi:MAG: hypothetical protein R3B07_26255 [Polyangiaceae bacterium]